DACRLGSAGGGPRPPQPPLPRVRTREHPLGTGLAEDERLVRPMLPRRPDTATNPHDRVRPARGPRGISGLARPGPAEGGPTDCRRGPDGPPARWFPPPA